MNHELDFEAAYGKIAAGWSDDNPMLELKTNAWDGDPADLSVPQVQRLIAFLQTFVDARTAKP